jgi:hypothetical protein
MDMSKKRLLEMRIYSSFLYNAINQNIYYVWIAVAVLWCLQRPLFKNRNKIMKSKCGTKFSCLIVKLMRFDTHHKLLFSMYPNTVIIVWLQLVHPDYSNLFNISSYLLAVGFLVGFIIYYPLWMIVELNKNFDYINTHEGLKEYSLKMKMVLKDVKLYSRLHISVRVYNLVRIMLYNTVVVLLYNHPGAVLLILMLICAVAAIYMITGKPYMNHYTWSNMVDSEMWIVLLILLYYVIFRVENYVTLKALNMIGVMYVAVILIAINKQLYVSIIKTAKEKIVKWRFRRANKLA